MIDTAAVLKSSEEQMSKAVAHLDNELQKIRAGAANPGMLESVRVDYYGQMPARVGDVDGEAVVRVLQGSFVAAGAELVLVGDAAALVRQSPDLRDAAVLLPIQVTDGL